MAGELPPAPESGFGAFPATSFLDLTDSSPQYLVLCRSRCE